MSEQPYFMNPNFGGFGQYDLADEGLHPRFKADFGPELTETHFFGFSVPDAQIHAILYAWHHPNLGLVSGGANVFRGVKGHAPGAELADYRYFMADSAFVETFPNYRFDSGYEVEMLEEGRLFRTRYKDSARGNAFDVTHRAISESIMWPGDKHFEQVMRTEGELTLRGEHFRVDGYHVRDRSWGQPRPETPFAVPPHSWMTAVFSDDLAFHLTATDDPSRDPVWKAVYPDFDGAQSVKFGWMLIDGRKTMIKSASKLTDYDLVTLMPRSCRIEVVDEHDRTHRLAATIVAGTPMHYWHNTRIPICLARWEYEGRIGWGDFQDVQYPDFVLAYS